MSGGKLERANGEREAHYVRLARHLRNRLGDGLSADGRLPSYRTLADEFSVSIGVVQRAMELLRQESLVQIHHGKSGRIVPGKSVQPEIAKYGMIHPYTPGNDFERNLIAIASDVFDRECNHAVPIVRSSNGSSARERELAETMVYNGVRGMLLSPENESANANYFQELARRIPVMLIDQPLGDADLPLVMFDYAAAGEEIGRKIRRSGCRRTLLLLNEKTNSSIEALTANMSEHVTTFAFRAPLFRMAARVKQRDFALFDTIRERLLKELEACEADSVFSPFDILLDHLVCLEMPPKLRARLQCAAIRGDRLEWHSRNYCGSGVWEWSASHTDLIRRAVERLNRWQFSHQMPRGVRKIKLKEVK